jgi:hypothetical protein
VTEDPNPFRPPIQDSTPAEETDIRRSANWAAGLAAVGVFVFPPVGLVAWVPGRKALKAIKLRGQGREHRAAAQCGIIASWICLALTLMSLLLPR